MSLKYNVAIRYKMAAEKRLKDHITIESLLLFCFLKILI